MTLAGLNSTVPLATACACIFRTSWIKQRAAGKLSVLAIDETTSLVVENCISAVWEAAAGEYLALRVCTVASPQHRLSCRWQASEHKDGFSMPWLRLLIDYITHATGLSPL